MRGRKVHIEVIARGVLVRGRELLVCRNTKHGYCFLPGGHVEPEESAPAALRREFLEETGCRVRVGELMAVSEGSFRQQGRRHHEINLLFHVELVGSRLRDIKSREPKIEFVWIRSNRLALDGFRPVELLEWVRGRVEGGTRSDAHAGCAWISHMSGRG